MALCSSLLVQLLCLPLLGRIGEAFSRLLEVKPALILSYTQTYLRPHADAFDDWALVLSKLLALLETMPPSSADSSQPASAATTPINGESAILPRGNIYLRMYCATLEHTASFIGSDFLFHLAISLPLFKKKGKHSFSPTF